MGPIKALWDTVGLRWRLPSDHQFDHLRVRRNPLLAAYSYVCLSQDVSEKRRALLANIERSSFQWRVVVAAGAGIFTASYNLAATNFILPILTALYWPLKPNNQVLVLEMALAGMFVGQILFGVLADRFGRRKLSELAVTYAGVGILGFAQSSTGLDGSMSILGWICFWRFVMGIGLGAQYPLAAVLTAEFAPSRHRSRMMAAVFSMQSLGSLWAALITFLVTKNVFQNTSENNQVKTADQVWRVIAGVGAIPAFVTALLLFTMPESPRYTFDVKMQADKALETMSAYTIDRSVVLANSIQEMMDRDNGGSFDVVSDRFNHFDDRSERSAPDNFRLHYQIYNYLIKDGNWRYLLGTTFSFFLIDLAFYGLDPFSADTMSFLWGATAQFKSEASSDAILDHSKRFMLVVSVASVVGSAIAIYVVGRASRKSLFTLVLPALAALYLLAGVVIITASDNASKTALYGLTFALIPSKSTNLNQNVLD
jgi:MFS transporter, PHS family, inorganic phosphate transporter